MQRITSKKEFLELLENLLPDNIMIDGLSIETVNDVLIDTHRDWRVKRPSRETVFRFTIDCRTINEV